MKDTIRTSSIRDKASTSSIKKKKIKVNAVGKEAMGRGPRKPREGDKGLTDECEEEIYPNSNMCARRTEGGGDSGDSPAGLE